MPLHRTAPIAAALLLLVGLAACLPVSTPYDMSAPVPDAAHPGVETRSDGSAAYTAGPLTLRLEARNRHPNGTGVVLAGLIMPVPIPTGEGPERPDSILYLALDLHLAAGSATIDPMAFRLIRDGSAPIAPLAFQGPAASDYYWCGYDSPWSAEPGPQAISAGSKGACVMLAFASTSAIDSAFTLNVAGIMVDGRPAALGTVRFARFHGHAAHPRDWHPDFPAAGQ